MTMWGIRMAQRSISLCEWSWWVPLHKAIVISFVEFDILSLPCHSYPLCSRCSLFNRAQIDTVPSTLDSFRHWLWAKHNIWKKYCYFTFRSRCYWAICMYSLLFLHFTCIQFHALSGTSTHLLDFTYNPDFLQKFPAAKYSWAHLNALCAAIDVTRKPLRIAGCLAHAFHSEFSHFYRHLLAQTSGQ